MSKLDAHTLRSHRIISRTFKIPRVVVFTGPTGSGKTYAGTILSMLGYQPLAFGNFVREDLINSIIQYTYPQPPLMAISGSSWVESIPTDIMEIWTSLRCLLGRNKPSVRNVHDLRATVYQKPTPPPMRRLLQWYGTDYRRDMFSETYWTDLASGSFRNMVARFPVVITDWRFESEEKLWNDARIRPLKIRLLPRDRRDLTEQQSLALDQPVHKSEANFDSLSVDSTFVNDLRTIGVDDTPTFRLTGYLRGMLVEGGHRNISRVSIRLPATFMPGPYPKLPT